ASGRRVDVHSHPVVGPWRPREPGVEDVQRAGRVAVLVPVDDSDVPIAPQLPLRTDARGVRDAGLADVEIDPVTGHCRVDDLREHFHAGDRKSTRLNSSHVAISYAVFCLKKKTVRDGALYMTL